MNLKPNLWTVLFVLALIGCYYFYARTPQTPGTSVKSLAAVAADCKCTIDSADFRTYYGDYITNYYDQVIQDTALVTSVGFDSVGVRAYTMSEYELEHMFQVYTAFYNVSESSKIHVYPIIKNKVIRGGKGSSMRDLKIRELDLVFRIVGPENKEYFFDFTEPCPTVCGNVPYTLSH